MYIVWSFIPPDLVVCISEDEEEKEEKVEEEKSTRRKKPNLKKEREEEAEELYKPSSSQTQSTRATVRYEHMYCSGTCTWYYSHSGKFSNQFTQYQLYSL